MVKYSLPFRCINEKSDLCTSVSTDVISVVGLGAFIIQKCQRVLFSFSICFPPNDDAV